MRALDYPTAVYLFVGDQGTRIAGYSWRLWAGGTSFYIKPRYRPMCALKISLHGPRAGDDRPGFKVAIEGGAIASALAAGGAFVSNLPNGRLWFPGRPAQDGAQAAITIRSTWDLFQPGVPSAPTQGNLPHGAQGLRVPAPTRVLEATDVDLYVRHGAPYWPDEQQARRDNACLPAIRNEADQYLSGVVVRRNSLRAIVKTCGSILVRPRSRWAP
jgi:hypothetical protein